MKTAKTWALEFWGEDGTDVQLTTMVEAVRAEWQAAIAAELRDQSREFEGNDSVAAVMCRGSFVYAADLVEHFGTEGEK